MPNNGMPNRMPRIILFELCCLKVWQISKDYARSREITIEPYMRLNYEYTDNLYLREISQRKTLSKN